MGPQRVEKRKKSRAPSTKNPESVTPKTSVKVDEGKLELPEFYDTVKTLCQTVDVDYYLSDCACIPWLVE